MTRTAYRSNSAEPVSFEMPAMDTSAAPLTVLVVDDDSDQRFLVRRRLETAGIQVRTAASAEEGLAALDGADLVLLDYRLPGTSELEGERGRLLAEARRMISIPEVGLEPRVDDSLLVPLPTSQGLPLGVLAVLASRPRVFVAEELRLARSLAAYAGIALANVRRLDLERTLVGELQEMLDMRREVMASVSHELRTPITCVAGFADTLLTHW